MSALSIQLYYDSLHSLRFLQTCLNNLLLFAHSFLFTFSIGDKSFFYSFFSSWHSQSMVHGDSTLVPVIPFGRKPVSIGPSTGLEYLTCSKVEEGILFRVRSLLLSRHARYPPRTPWPSEDQYLSLSWGCDLDGEPNCHPTQRISKHTDSEGISFSFTDEPPSSTDIMELRPSRRPTDPNPSVNKRLTLRSTSSANDIKAIERLSNVEVHALDCISTHTEGTWCTQCPPLAKIERQETEFSCYVPEKSSENLSRPTKFKLPGLALQGKETSYLHLPNISLRSKEHVRPQYDFKAVAPAISNLGLKLQDVKIQSPTFTPVVQNEQVVDQVEEHLRPSISHVPGSYRSEIVSALVDSSTSLTPLQDKSFHSEIATMHVSPGGISLRGSPSHTSIKTTRFTPSLLSSASRSSAHHHAFLKPSTASLNSVDLGLPVPPILTTAASREVVHSTRQENFGDHSGHDAMSAAASKLQSVIITNAAREHKSTENNASIFAGMGVIAGVEHDDTEDIEVVIDSNNTNPDQVAPGKAVAHSQNLAGEHLPQTAYWDFVPGIEKTVNDAVQEAVRNAVFETIEQHQGESIEASDAYRKLVADSLADAARVANEQFRRASLWKEGSLNSQVTEVTSSQFEDIPLRSNNGSTNPEDHSAHAKDNQSQIHQHDPFGDQVQSNSGKHEPRPATKTGYNYTTLPGTSGSLLIHGSNQLSGLALSQDVLSAVSSDTIMAAGQDDVISLLDHDSAQRLNQGFCSETDRAESQAEFNDPEIYTHVKNSWDFGLPWISHSSSNKSSTPYSGISVRQPSVDVSQRKRSVISFQRHHKDSPTPRHRSPRHLGTMKKIRSSSSVSSLGSTSSLNKYDEVLGDYSNSKQEEKPLKTRNSLVSSLPSSKSTGGRTVHWLRDLLNNDGPYAPRLTALPTRHRHKASVRLRSESAPSMPIEQVYLGATPKPQSITEQPKASEAFAKTIGDLEHLLNEALWIARIAAERDEAAYDSALLENTAAVLGSERMGLDARNKDPTHQEERRDIQRLRSSSDIASTIGSVHKSQYSSSLISNSSFRGGSRDEYVPELDFHNHQFDSQMVENHGPRLKDEVWPEYNPPIHTTVQKGPNSYPPVAIHKSWGTQLVLGPGHNEDFVRPNLNFESSDTQAKDNSASFRNARTVANFQEFTLQDVEDAVEPSNEYMIDEMLVGQGLEANENFASASHAIHDHPGPILRKPIPIRQPYQDLTGPEIRLRQPNSLPNKHEVREYIRVFHKPPIQSRQSSLHLKKRDQLINIIHSPVGIEAPRDKGNSVSPRPSTPFEHEFAHGSRTNDIDRHSFCSSHSLNIPETIADFDTSYGIRNRGTGKATGTAGATDELHEPSEAKDMHGDGNLPTRHLSGRRMHRPLMQSLNLTGKSHVSLREHHGFSLSRSHKRKPIARDWSPFRKRWVASIACISTALIGILVGIYAGLVPSIQYYIVDFHHYAILGNVFFFVGLAIPTLLFWPLPLLHGRKPYILSAMTVAMPLLFPQAVAVSIIRSPYVRYWRIGLLLPRALMGFCLGFANMNFKYILTDLFGASLQSGNPHQEVVDEFDVRRHGGGMGVWLGIWAWCFVGSIGVGFLVGSVIINYLTPAWGIYICIVIIATVLFLNVLAPEVRRSAYRRSVVEIRTENEKTSRRVARGEIMMHRKGTGPKWWGKEAHHGVVLSIEMLRQPGFLVMALYVAWIYGQIVLIIVVSFIPRD
jgi:MFS family permease